MRLGGKQQSEGLLRQISPGPTLCFNRRAQPDCHPNILCSLETGRTRLSRRAHQCFGTFGHQHYGSGLCFLRIIRSIHCTGAPVRLSLREKQFREEDVFYKITNYDTVFRDQQAIERWAPDLVILDEAQRIKNWKTRTARSVKLIESPYCIVLTGTPLENRLEELVSIVQFIDRHRLGPTFRFLHDHQEFEEGTTRVIGYRNLDRIGETLKPILIRRRKDEVLDQLPERIDKNFFVPMTPQQMDLHEENREAVAKVIAKWRRFGYLAEADQRRLMICLQNMRMSCNSTFLLDKKTDFGTKADEWATLLEEVFEEPGVKAVVFSQWVRTHELLQRRIADRNWDHIFFHGGVPSPKRKGLVDRFREDPDCRLFLSTDAGGVGLNLQSASVVVNMDLPWNPAILEQRIGRVHRLGQKRPVQVFNFIAEGTIEHGMLGLLGFKQSLFAGVLDGGEKNVFLGGSRLKLFMESVETATADCQRAPQPTEPEVAANGSPQAEDRIAAESPSPAPVATDPLAGLLQNGLALLEQLAGAASNTASPGESSSARHGGIEIVRDESGKPPYLKLPMPEPELLNRVLSAVQQLVSGSR
ncbi:MAG: DEAD/DEAH box helicase [Planctomycetes bacterium]|nr:DEAD/DEAH box helicase [Planctomycetota bacterium]